MKRSILYFGYALTLCFMINSVGFAQTSNSDSTMAVKNSLKHDMWALEFGINPNFTLNSFQGSVLSAKRQFNSHEAIELGIGVSFNNQNGTLSSSSEVDSSVVPSPPTSSLLRNVGVQINLQYVYYINPDADVNIYLGSGPTFGIRSNNNSNDQQLPPGLPGDWVSETSYSNYKETDWNIGLSGVAGVECFVLSYLSLHAQYGLTIGYNATNTTAFGSSEWIETRNGQPIMPPTSISSTSSESKSHSWSIGASSVLFGLSVYFK